MIRSIVDIASYVALFAALLFRPAGTLHWWRGWTLVGVLLCTRIVSTISVTRVNQAILLERSKFPIQSGQPFADKILVSLFMGTFAALVVFASFDVFHLRLFSVPNLLISSLGMVLFVMGWWIITIVLRTNPFAVTVVRYQEELHHSVVDRGLYGIVRHPMYTGLALVIVGMCLWLESYAGTLLSVVPIGILIIRIHVEENFLKRELEGYEKYTSQVRWRLVPGIW
jgi:protein-S-isoprenylcysteine O-methyltransferase Ste14